MLYGSSSAKVLYYPERTEEELDGYYAPLTAAQISEFREAFTLFGNIPSPQIICL